MSGAGSRAKTRAASSHELAATGSAKLFEFLPHVRCFAESVLEDEEVGWRWWWGGGSLSK